jgi:hypothetical protein
MELRFQIADKTLSSDELDALVQNFALDAQDEGLSVTPVFEKDASAISGRRGEPVTLGVLALALVTSGSVVALFNLLKSYVERSEELTIEFSKKRGAPIKLAMKNISLDKFKAVIKELEKHNG